MRAAKTMGSFWKPAEPTERGIECCPAKETGTYQKPFGDLLIGLDPEVGGLLLKEVHLLQVHR